MRGMSEANKTNRHYHKKKCAACGSEFLAYTRNQIHCSTCRKEYERAYFKQYGTRSKPNGGQCCVCGQPLSGRQTLYCSRKCLDQARKDTGLKKQAVMLRQPYACWDADPYEGKAMYFDGLHSLRSREPAYYPDPAWGF